MTTGSWRKDERGRFVIYASMESGEERPVGYALRREDAPPLAKAREMLAVLQGLRALLPTEQRGQERGQVIIQIEDLQELVRVTSEAEGK